MILIQSAVLSKHMSSTGSRNELMRLNWSLLFLQFFPEAVKLTLAAHRPT